jgi:hypothetical protein
MSKMTMISEEMLRTVDRQFNRFISSDLPTDIQPTHRDLLDTQRMNQHPLSTGAEAPQTMIPLSLEDRDFEPIDEESDLR